MPGFPWTALRCRYTRLTSLVVVAPPLDRQLPRAQRGVGRNVRGPKRCAGDNAPCLHTNLACGSCSLDGLSRCVSVLGDAPKGVADGHTEQ